MQSSRMMKALLPGLCLFAPLTIFRWRWITRSTASLSPPPATSWISRLADQMEEAAASVREKGAVLVSVQNPMNLSELDLAEDNSDDDDEEEDPYTAAVSCQFKGKGLVVDNL